MRRGGGGEGWERVSGLGELSLSSSAYGDYLQCVQLTYVAPDDAVGSDVIDCTTKHRN